MAEMRQVLGEMYDTQVCVYMADGQRWRGELTEIGSDYLVLGPATAGTEPEWHEHDNKRRVINLAHIATVHPR